MHLAASSSACGPSVVYPDPTVLDPDPTVLDLYPTVLDPDQNVLDRDPNVLDPDPPLFLSHDWAGRVSSPGPPTNSDKTPLVRPPLRRLLQITAGHGEEIISGRRYLSQ